MEYDTLGYQELDKLRTSFRNELALSIEALADMWHKDSDDQTIRRLTASVVVVHNILKDIEGAISILENVEDGL